MKLPFFTKKKSFLYIWIGLLIAFLLVFATKRMSTDDEKMESTDKRPKAVTKLNDIDVPMSQPNAELISEMTPKMHTKPEMSKHVETESVDGTNIEHLLAEDARKESKKYREEIKKSLTAKGVVKGIQEIPMGKLFFVEAQNGMYFISSDGRYVFEGVMKDVWHRKTIRNLEDARTLERTPVSNIGFEPEEQLAFIKIGNNNIPRQGVAFVDPTSEHTLSFINTLLENKESVNWTMILMPLVGGNQAVDRARRIHCAVNREGAKQDFIDGTSNHLSEMKPGCTEEKILMGMMLTDLYQIRSLPHIIREDGLVSKGLPIKFYEWFKQP